MKRLLEIRSQETRRREEEKERETQEQKRQQEKRFNLLFNHQFSEQEVQVLLEVAVFVEKTSKRPEYTLYAEGGLIKRFTYAGDMEGLCTGVVFYVQPRDWLRST